MINAEVKGNVSVVQQAMGVVNGIGKLLCDSTRLESVIADNAQRNSQYVHDIASLASGSLGWAIALLSLSETPHLQPELKKQFRTRAENLLGKVSTAKRVAPYDSIGLFDGTAGYVYAIIELASVDSRYVTTAKKLSASLLLQYQRLTQYSNDNKHVSPYIYDTICGASGVSNVLSLAAERNFNLVNPSREFALRLIDRKSIDALLKSPMACIDQLYSPPLGERFPEGYVDIGTAHGFFGVLSAIRPSREGPERIQQHSYKSIAKLALTLLKARADEPALSRRLGQPDHRRRSTSTVGWCYGYLSRVAILMKFANAYQDMEIVSWCQQEIGSIIQDVRDQNVVQRMAHVGQFGLCHGISGYLLCLSEISILCDSVLSERLRILDFLSDSALNGMNSSTFFKDYVQAGF